MTDTQDIESFLPQNSLVFLFLPKLFCQDNVWKFTLEILVIEFLIFTTWGNRFPAFYRIKQVLTSPKNWSVHNQSLAGTVYFMITLGTDIRRLKAISESSIKPQAQNVKTLNKKFGIWTKQIALFQILFLTQSSMLLSTSSKIICIQNMQPKKMQLSIGY